MKTKILGAVAGLAVLAAVAGAGAGSAEAGKYHRDHDQICGFTWVKVFPKHAHHKHFHHHHYFTWKQVWKCGRPLLYY